MPLWVKNKQSRTVREEGRKRPKKPFWGVRGERKGCAEQQEGSGLLPAEQELEQGCSHPDTPSARRRMPLCTVEA